jgi:ribose transport system ATP-binding protein
MRVPGNGPIAAPEGRPANKAIIELQEITKRFPGTVALDNVSIVVRPCEVVGLVGQNGSGKSTLLKILCGVYQPDGGRILVDGRPVTFHGPSQARKTGIGMVFQEQSLLPNLTVAENIALGAESIDRPSRALYPWRRVERLARNQLEVIGSPIPPRTRVSELSQLERQTVELAKALTAELYAPENALLLLDEPTSTLSQHEIDILFREIRRVGERSSVIFVSHRLEEILEVSDRVYVLRDGRCVAERRRGAWDVDEFFRLMVGRESHQDYFRVERQQAFDSESVVLAVKDLTKRGDYADISFDLHAGEVLGICGLEGAGRAQLMRTFFGAERPDSGRMVIAGTERRFRSPEDAVRYGVAYIPAERSEEAAFMEMDVAENMTIAHIEEVTRSHVVSRKAESSVASKWIERLNIKTPSFRTMMASLSGGNQQKVVFARWLLSPEIRLLLLDHPTRGLDVGAKTEVYGIIRDAAASGTAIVLVSDSLEEAIALSHTIIVMKDGEVTERLPAPPDAKPSQFDILAKML